MPGDVIPSDGNPWAPMLRLFGDPDPDDDAARSDTPGVSEVFAAEEASADPDADPDAAIAIANLRGELAARDAEIAALRSQVQRPGYDADLGDVVGKRKPGRPRVVTPDVQAAILRHLRAGQSRARACALVRISTDSLTHAVRADPAFKAEVRRAEQLAIAAAVRCFGRAAREDWKAAESLLKRRVPNEWAMPSERIVAPNVEAGKALKEDALNSLVAALVGPVLPGEPTHARAPSEDADEDPEDPDGGLPAP